MSITGESFDREVQGAVVYKGFRPLLATVTTANGWNSAGQLGAHKTGKPISASYKNFQIDGSTAIILTGTTTVNAHTRCKWRQSGKVVEFYCCVTLDTSKADPQFTGSDELRIYVDNVLSGEPNRYAVGLPRPDPTYPQVLHSDVVGVNKNDIQVIPTANTPDFTLHAQQLRDGEIALLKRNMGDANAAATSLAPLLVSDIAGLFGNSNTILKICVRGRYTTM